jgi:hypothetical protein
MTTLTFWRALGDASGEEPVGELRIKDGKLDWSGMTEKLIDFVKNDLRPIAPESDPEAYLKEIYLRVRNPYFWTSKDET